MPWPWQLAVHCMDLQQGTFVHWPLAGGWRANKLYLDLMLAVWRAWRFCLKPASEWSEYDLAYREWLDEGRSVVTETSRYEQWIAENYGNDDG